MMKRVSFGETIFLFFLALIVFGPKKLPEIARQVGKLMSEFRRASNEFKSQIEQEIAHLEVEERKKTVLPPSAPPEGTAGRTLTAGSELGPVGAPATLAATSEQSQPAAPPQVATEALPSSENASAEAAAAAARVNPESFQESPQEPSQETRQESHA